MFFKLLRDAEEVRTAYWDPLLLHYSGVAMHFVRGGPTFSAVWIWGKEQRIKVKLNGSISCGVQCDISPVRVPRAFGKQLNPSNK